MGGKKWPWLSTTNPSANWQPSIACSKASRRTQERDPERHANANWRPYAVRVLKQLFRSSTSPESAQRCATSACAVERRWRRPARPAQETRSGSTCWNSRPTSSAAATFTEYLTDEEKDIEEQIKNEVETADILKANSKPCCSTASSQRKIRHNNGQDYPYTRKMDDRRPLSREHELVSTSSRRFGQLRQPHPCNACMQADEVGGLCRPTRFMQDPHHAQAHREIKHPAEQQHSAGSRQTHPRRQGFSRAAQRLQVRARALLGKATLIINAADVDVSSEDGQTRAQGLRPPSRSFLPQPAHAARHPFNEADIGKRLRMIEDGLLANDATSSPSRNRNCWPSSRVMSAVACAPPSRA